MSCVDVSGSLKLTAIDGQLKVSRLEGSGKAEPLADVAKWYMLDGVRLNGSQVKTVKHWVADADDRGFIV